MVDIQSLVNETLAKGMSVWAVYEDVPGFEIEVAWVGRDEMQKIYAKCTRRRWNRQARRMEDVPDREKLVALWAERAIKDWRGLTLGGLVKLVPIELKAEDDSKAVIECTPENKAALLKHNADFDDFVLAIATDSEVFMEHRKDAKQQTANLEPSLGG